MRIKRDNGILLTGRRIHLRTYKSSDAPDISAVASCREIYDTTYNMPLDFSKSYAEWWIRFLSSTRRNRTGFEFGIFDNDTEGYVGHCGINNISKNCNHGNLVYFISKDFWNKGYATEASKLMISFGFENLSLNRISGICMSHNTASARVLEKAGMQYEGLGRSEILKDGRYIDVMHFSVLKNDLPPLL